MDNSSVVIPSHVNVVIPRCAFLVRGFLCPAACAVLGPQIVNETFPLWVAQMSYSKGWPARIDKGHHMARFGDPGVTYTYKDKTKPMHAFTPGLDRVRSHLVKHLAWIPNCVVVNSYAPTSGLYPHRDGRYIPQLGQRPTIASVSFGATRTFQLFHADPMTNKRIRGRDPIKIQLSEGDLFVMHGDCDLLFHHGIPEEPHVNVTRLSLTFRRHLIV